MRVQINVYMMLRRKLGWGSKTLEIKRSKMTLREVLKSLPEFRDLVDSPSFIREYIVLVNGVNASLLRGLETEITGDTNIDVFPPGGGG